MFSCKGFQCLKCLVPRPRHESVAKPHPCSHPCIAAMLDDIAVHPFVAMLLQVHAAWHAFLREASLFNDASYTGSQLLKGLQAGQPSGCRHDELAAGSEHSYISRRLTGHAADPAGDWQRLLAGRASSELRHCGWPLCRHGQQQVVAQVERRRASPRLKVAALVCTAGRQVCRACSGLANRAATSCTASLPTR